MTNFQELQNSWLSQPVENNTIDHAAHVVQDKWEKHQRKLRRSNICMSIGFIIASSVITWVYITYHNEYNWPFDMSIASAFTLMVVFAVLSWKSYDFKKDQRDISGIEYLNNQIGKLKWQKKMLTRYMWIYSVLLYLALVGYIVEITKRGSLLFTLTALAITTAYIAAVSLWNRFYKQKKQLKTIDDLLKDFEQMRSGIE